MDCSCWLWFAVSEHAGAVDPVDGNKSKMRRTSLDVGITKSPSYQKKQIEVPIELPMIIV
jgi:hypothetical protein